MVYNSHSTTFFFLQTGICGQYGGCIVRDVVEVNSVDATSVSAILITDRNDGGKQYKGLDFEALLVKECPSERKNLHCEASGGGKCVMGFCICNGGIPCSCSCDGKPPGFLGSLRTGLVVGIVLPLFLIFIGFFAWYRRRKILKSRAQKEVIQAKEVELEVFRNSVVGMRTAIKEYIPQVKFDDHPEMPMPRRSGIVVAVPPQPPKVQWCWQETSHLISNHAPDTIVGEPVYGWIKYDNDSNTILEVAFQKQDKRGQFSPLPGYVVDFNTMIQTKTATGFRRGVQRLVDTSSVPQQDQNVEHDLTDAQMGERLPQELLGEPQMVLVTGDIVQISTQRQDDWAFGTKVSLKFL
jgi:hypothetical protein